MHNATRPHDKLPYLIAAAACALWACGQKNVNAVDPNDCNFGLCAGSAAATTTNGVTGTGGSAGAAGSSASSGGTNSSSGAATSNGSGGRTGSGGNPASSNSSAGKSGTASNAGTGTAGSSGTTSSGGSPSTGGSGSTPLYSLTIDTPSSGAMISGNVTVSGHAPGFKNVEVWDSTHQTPPLGQVTPSADGSFTTMIDVSALTAGATTWTVYAWDSTAGQSFMHTTNVALNLTIQGSSTTTGSCTGQTCSGHGTCSVSGTQATCTCNTGYHAVGVSCVADSTGGDGSPDPGTSYVPAGYTLKFNDEFDGSTLDTGKWNTLAPFGKQFYSDSGQKQAFVPEAISLKNGILTFTANHASGASSANGQPYTSGSITTNGTFTHGYFESRVRMAKGKGFWPAYWLTSSTRWPPEWDIFEIIDDTIYGYTHPISGGKCQFVEGASGSDSTYMISNLYGQYHIFGFTWTASDIYWYVDGVLTEHYAIDAAAGANDPFWLNISFQLGGSWPGDPDSSTPFPAYMDVDYMRVYQQ